MIYFKPKFLSLIFYNIMLIPFIYFARNIDEKQNKNNSCIKGFTRKCIQNFHIYHPLITVFFIKVHNRIALKLPLHIGLWILLVCVFLNLSLAITITDIFQSKCLDKRFNIANIYSCKQFQFHKMTIKEIIGLALIASGITVIISYIGIFKFSKNYLNFLDKFSQFKHQKIMQEMQSRPMIEQENANINQQKHVPTLQNMLNQDSDYTRRSLRGFNDDLKKPFQLVDNKLDDFTQSQQDFRNKETKIPTDSFQNPSSTNLLNYNINELNYGDKGNLINISKIQEMRNDQTFVNSSLPDQSNLIKLKSCNNLEDINLSQSNYNTSIMNSDKKLKHQDTRLDRSNKNTNLSLNKLDIIKEDLLEDKYLTEQKVGKDSQKNLKTEIEGVEGSPDDIKNNNDSSRVQMIQNNNGQGMNNNKIKNKKRIQIIKIIGLIIAVSLFIMGILLDFYVFFNMTYDGLIQALKVFGFSLLFDFLGIRVIINTIVSLLQVLKQIKNGLSIYEHDGDQLNALSQLYKAYQAPYSEYEGINNNDEEEANQNAPNFGLRFIKIQPSGPISDPYGNNIINNNNILPGEILLVEPTYPNVYFKNGPFGNNYNNNLGRRGEQLPFQSTHYFNGGNGVYGPNEDDIDEKDQQRLRNVKQNILQYVKGGQGMEDETDVDQKNNNYNLNGKNNIKKNAKQETDPNSSYSLFGKNSKLGDHDDIEDTDQQFYRKNKKGEYVPISGSQLFSGKNGILNSSLDDIENLKNNLFKKNKNGEMVPVDYSMLFNHGNNNYQYDDDVEEGKHDMMKRKNKNNNSIGLKQVFDLSNQKMQTDEQTVDIIDANGNKKGNQGEIMNPTGFKQSSFLPQIHGQKGLQNINTNFIYEDSNKKNKQDIQNVDQSNSYNLGFHSQSSPNQNQNLILSNNSSPYKTKNQGQIVMYDDSNSYDLKNAQLNRKQLEGIDIDSRGKQNKKQGIFSALSRQFFNLPIIKSLWEKKNKQYDGIDLSKNKTLQQIFKSGNPQFYNLPLVYNNNNDLDQILSNQGFKQISKNSKGQILMAQSKALFNLPLQFLPKNNKEYEGIDLSKRNKNSGEKLRYSQIKNYDLKDQNIDKQQKNQNIQDLHKLLMQQILRRKNGELLEVDATSIFKLPMFDKNGKLIKEMVDLQKLLLQQLCKKKQNGETVEIDSSSLFNFSELLAKHGLMSPEIQKLTNKILDKINKKKKNGEIVEIDSSSLYTFSLLYGSDDKLNKDQKEIKFNLIRKKQEEILKVASSQNYDLPLIINQNGQLNNQIKEIFLQLQKIVQPGEVIQIDSTLFFNLPLEKPEMEEFKKFFMKAIKKGKLGEIVEIDSTMFFNLPLFMRDEAQLSDEMRNLKNYLMLQMINKRINPGEIVKIDASFAYDLPLIVQKLQKQQQEYDAENVASLIVKADKKRRTNVQEILGVDGQIIFNAEHPSQMMKLKLSSQKLDQSLLNTVNNNQPQGQPFETPSNIKTGEKQLKDLLYNESRSNLEKLEDFRSLNKYINDDPQQEKEEFKLRLQVNNDNYEESNDGSDIDKDNKLPKIDKEKYSFSPQYSSLGKKKYFQETSDIKLSAKKDKSENKVKLDLRGQAFNEQEQEDEIKSNKNIFDFNHQNDLINNNPQSRNGSQQKKRRGSSPQKINYQEPQIIDGDSPNLDKIVQRKTINNQQYTTSPLQGKSLENFIKPQIKLKNTTRKSKLNQTSQEKEHSTFISDLKQNQIINERTEVENEQNLELKGKKKSSKASKNSQNQDLQNSYDLRNQILNSLNDDNNLITNSDTSRSKLFQDNDNSTFRMISFNKNNKQSQKDLQLRENNNSLQNHNSKNNNNNNNQEDPYQPDKLNFYQSNEKPPIADIGYQTFNNFAKDIEIKNKNSQQKQNVQVLDDGKQYSDYDSDYNNKNNQINTNNQENADFNILQHKNNNIIQEHNQQQLDMMEAVQQASSTDLKFAQRKQIRKKHYNKKVNRKDSRGGFNSSQSSSSNNQDNITSMYNNNNSQSNLKEKGKRYKEKKEQMMYRIQEQKRKLKHFLQLANKQKSQKDQDIINNLIETINQTQRPLPMARINELKTLEMMASPYNQSLILMIKEEKEIYKAKKQNKNNSNNNGRSMNRSDSKTGENLAKISNIYGQNARINRGDSMHRDSSDSSVGSSKRGGQNFKKPKFDKKNKLTIINNKISPQKFAEMRKCKEFNFYKYKYIENDNFNLSSLESDEDHSKINLKKKGKIEKKNQEIILEDSDEFNNIQDFVND